MDAIEIIERIGTVCWALMPFMVMIWLWMLDKNMQRLRDDAWSNSFEVKDILRDIKDNTVRNRELLIGDEVYDVDDDKPKPTF